MRISDWSSDVCSSDLLPGLVIVGWWSGFPYVTTAAITMLGGILGALFSVPLRRALVVGGGLPYPEGVAAADVLKIGSTTAIGVEESRQGLRLLMHGGFVSRSEARRVGTEWVRAVSYRW